MSNTRLTQRGKKSTPKANLINTLGGNLDVCPHCQDAVQEGQMGLQCERCLQWAHGACEGYTEQEYKLATKKKSLKYFCNKCDDNMKPGDGQSNAEMLKQINLLMEMVKGMSEKIKKMEESQQTVQSLEEKIDEMVTAKVEDALKEASDKQQRKLNLIIVNVRESSNPILAEAKEEDKKRIQSLLNEIMPEDEKVDVANPIRLGKPNIGTQPRRLRFTVQSEQVKRNILKNASKLNKPDMPTKEKIWINPDLTEKERKEQKGLRDLLKEKTKNGGKWRINFRTGEVVPIPEEDGTQDA